MYSSSLLYKAAMSDFRFCYLKVIGAVFLKEARSNASINAYLVQVTLLRILC